MIDRLSKGNLHTVRSHLRRTGALILGQPALVVSVVVSLLVLGVRQQGLLETLELGAYDQMIRLRPAEEPDPRILVVAVTEADIQTYKQYPLSDERMHQLLAKLLAKEPRVIGLDIFRDLPVPPGHAGLAALMQKDSRIVPVCKVKDSESPGNAAPPSVSESRVGFSDVKVDRDGILRRALLFLSPSAHEPCPNPNSLGFQLVQRYLEKEGIVASETSEHLRWKNTVFKPLEANDGGYQGMDARGYQILLNYRSGNRPANQITMSQVLNGQFDPSWVKDRIVLIGVTASSVDDAFYTPYSGAQKGNRKMPGIVTHAQLVSQMLSAVLDGRRLFWFWSDWGEALWVLGWSVTGGLMALRLRHPGHLLLGQGAALGVLFGTCWVLFTQAGWVPVVPAAIALVGTAAGVVAYSAHQAEQNQKKIALLVQEQQFNLAQLQALLQQKNQEPETEEVATAIAPASLSVLPNRDDDDDDDETQPWQPSLDVITEPERMERQRLDASPVKNGDSLRPSLLMGRYKILRPLASGGFGHTYLAEDTMRPGKPQCAVKHLMPALRDEKFLKVAKRLFFTEAAILESLGHHSQIPQLLAYFEEHQEFYLIEEFIKGHPLTDELLVDKRLPEAQVVEILCGVLEILIFIHENQVIHRDVKPSNIIRREKDGRLVLIDFGAVKQIQPQEEEQERRTIAIGTRGYTPAEQYDGQPRFSSDIYALGMIGVEAVTGIPPSKLETDRNTGNINWREFALVRDEFAEILDKMVRFHFVTRYQSATEVLQDLKRLPNAPV
ncbi:CHASE2 domain-containing protein [Coleofasciculus sp. H7-2]|uniref:CHASE2 domain-containing protein n=1 Tax=Coleofasciculus sp. H7-2 TaxID=3351545 RepID=UPI00366F37F4